MSTKAGIVAAAVLATSALAACATAPLYGSNAQQVEDSTITANVKAALLQDPETRGSNISVSTLRGRVELTGFVNSAQEGIEAQRDAGSVAGVRFVEDKLQINSG